MIAAAAISASIQNIDITVSVGLVLAALGIFTAPCILAADYIKDIIILARADASHRRNESSVLII